MLPSPLRKIQIILTLVRQIKQSTPKFQNLTHPIDRRTDEKEDEKTIDMKEIHNMFSTMMKKLEKLDAIESDMKQIKHSLEFAHAEITDLKKEQETAKAQQ
jgi:hypothetical protein